MVTKSMMRGILICGMRYAVCGMRYAVCGERCVRSRVASASSSADNWEAVNNNFDLNSTGKNNRSPRSLGYALTQLGGDNCVCLGTWGASADFRTNLNMKGAMPRIKLNFQFGFSCL